MQLTQEYFDKSLANLMEKMTGEFSSIRAEMATKEDLKAQSQELKQYTQEAFEIQQDWMEERFNELVPSFDVRDRVAKLEKDVAQLKLVRH